MTTQADQLYQQAQHRFHTQPRRTGSVAGRKQQLSVLRLLCEVKATQPAQPWVWPAAHDLNGNLFANLERRGLAKSRQVADGSLSYTEYCLYLPQEDKRCR